MKRLDITAQRYGLLIALCLDEMVNGRAVWMCQCDCGNITNVPLNSLRSGNTKSCGCLRKKLTRARGKKNSRHGQSNTRLYRIWRCMRKRCNTQTDEHYPRYGARGISITEEWNDFEKFYQWAMSSGYTNRLSIDRINNNGNYEPSNCRWATPKEQAGNRSNTPRHTINGITKSLTDWSDMFDVNYSTAYSRLQRGVEPFLKAEQQESELSKGASYETE